MWWFYRMIFFIIFFLFSLYELTSSYEYCAEGKEKKLCKYMGYYKHVTCDPDQVHPDKNFVDFQGKFEVSYPMTKKIKKLIIDEHNYYRNRIANGSEVYHPKDGNSECCYPPASRMRELIWDDELQYTATFHAKLCRFGHDKCRNVFRYILSGQNIGCKLGTKEKTAALYTIKESMRDFYDEKNKISDGDFKAFRVKYLDKHMGCCGHFALLSQDQVSRVGCGIVRCSRHLTVEEQEAANARRQEAGKKPLNIVKPVKSSFLTIYTCNYDYSSILGYTIYKKGEPTSACSDFESEPSDNYQFLCKSTTRDYIKQQFVDPD